MSGIANFDQFAWVALNPYGSSSARRLTPSSTAGLMWNSNLGVGFPLRCFQRLSDGNVATRRFCWCKNRHTRDFPREVLSSIALQLLEGLDYIFNPWDSLHISWVLALLWCIHKLRLLRSSKFTYGNTFHLTLLFRDRISRYGDAFAWIF